MGRKFFLPFFRSAYATFRLHKKYAGTYKEQKFDSMTSSNLGGKWGKILRRRSTHLMLLRYKYKVLDMYADVFETDIRVLCVSSVDWVVSGFKGQRSLISGRLWQVKSFIIFYGTLLNIEKYIS